MSSRRTRRSFLAAVAASGIAAALVAPSTPGGVVTAARFSEQVRHVSRTQSVAFLKERASGESEGPRDNPATADYSNRAYPQTDVAPTQSRNAQQGYAKLPKKSAGGTTTSGTGSGPGAADVSGWSELGPFTPRVPGVLTDGGADTTVSGRATALAVAGPSTLFVGAAGGGVWRNNNALSGNGGGDWVNYTANLPTNAIGTLVYDAPTHTLYAGTGEPNGSGDSEAGLGVFKRDINDAASTWVLLPGSGYLDGSGVAHVAYNRAAASLVVQGNHILVGTAVARHGSSAVNGGRASAPNRDSLGVYESNDGGATFTRALSVLPIADETPDTWFYGGVTSVQADPRASHAGTYYASVEGYGLYRRVGAGAWTRIYTSMNRVDTYGDRIEFAPVALPGDKLRIYLGDGSDDLELSLLFRTDDADAVTPSDWTQLSDKNPAHPGGFASYNFCGGQCGYDEIVVSPPGHPDELYIGGQMQYDEVGGRSNGRAVQRSVDAGASFTDLTQELKSGTHKPEALHPDQHGLVFAPGSDTTVFESNDGGVVRIDATPQPNTDRCAARNLTGNDLLDCNAWLAGVPTSITPLNAGLPTLQFQSLSTDAAGDLMGGTQDNGTWSYNPGTGASSWFESIFGDGGQSGIDAGNRNVRIHTYYAASPDVNFRGDDPLGWDWIGDRLYNSKENQSFYIPIISDPRVSGTLYAGLQHVWRTKDNGGSQAYLDANCSELDLTHYTGRICGDWEAIGGGGSGGAYGHGDDGSAGDLTGKVYGSDRAGQYVVATERAPSNTGTLWAATRTGRVFVSTNADAKTDSVRFSRIDSAATPGRFVSGIHIDPADPNHAWISYSGYSAYAAGGHVYEVRFNPANSTSAWTDLSYNLPDSPVLDVVRTSTGDLYAATDFGVAHLGPGSGSWNATSNLPTTAVFGLTLAPNGHTLYAATHGRGAWKLGV